MVWAPANTFLFINPSPIGCISEMGDDQIRVQYFKQLRKTSAAVWFCLGLIPLKSISQEEYIALPYNTRASTLWTTFDGGNFRWQKGGSQHNAYTTSNKSFGVQKLTPPLKLRVDELLSKWLRLEKRSSQSDCRDLYFIDDTINEHYPNR